MILMLFLNGLSTVLIFQKLFIDLLSYLVNTKRLSNSLLWLRKKTLNAFIKPNKVWPNQPETHRKKVVKHPPSTLIACLAKLWASPFPSLLV